MNLRLFLVLTSLASFSAASAEEDELKVLGKESHQLLYGALLQQSRETYEERDQEITAALQSREQIQRRAGRLRADLRANIGTLPAERCPLNPKVTGVIDCGAYRIENVVFESRPSHRVTANLFVPGEGTAPFPGVLIACGHSPTGKIGYQSVGALFARNGFVALLYDPICQGERVQVAGFEKTAGHTRMLVGSVLVGRTVIGSEAWDGMRALDYLFSRGEVDKSLPVGMTGNSGGGCRTNFLMALDDRIGPAAPSCYVMRQHRKYETLGPGDGCQCLPNVARDGIDHADMAWIRAPRPTLILAAEKDFVEFRSTVDVARELQELYLTLGVPGKTRLFSVNDRHGFSAPRQRAAVAWMKRWLKEDKSPVIENTQPQRSAQDLQVTRTGQVLQEFEDEQSVMQLDLARARTLAAQRAEFWSQEPTEALRALRELIGSRWNAERELLVERKETLRREGYRIEKLLLHGPDGLPLPGLLFRPDQPGKGGTAYLHASETGKSSNASLKTIEDLMKDGAPVLSIDLRGYGETRDRMCRRKGFGPQFGIATLSLQLGTPLLGQRVDELLTATGALLREPGVETVHLVGSGAAAPVSLHAAALDERVASVTLHDSIRSWTDAIDRDPDPAYLIFGALEHYDLPDLAAAIAPRKVTWTGKDRERGEP